MNNKKSIIDLAKEATRPPSGEIPTPSNAEAPPAPVNPKQDPQGASIDAALKSLLSNVEDKKAWLPLTLPSMGFAGYSKEIRIRAFTFEDEKILRGIQNANQGDKVITQLISRCVEGVDVADLTIFDKTFLLFKLREISYGDEYNIEGECGGCGTTNELIVKLSELGVNYAEEDLMREITLPDSEVVAKVRPVLCKDEKLFQKASDIMDNLWRFVESIGGYTERMIIQKFIKQTTAKDIAVVREAVMEETTGLDMNVRFMCNSCGNDQNTKLPLNDHFFSVSFQQD